MDQPDEVNAGTPLASMFFLHELPTYHLITIGIPDQEAIRIYSADQLPPGWNTPVRTTELQLFLGEWLGGTQELAVALPSAVVPFSTNLILHRTHPAFEQVRVESIQPFTVDGRLVLLINYSPLDLSNRNIGVM